MTADIAKAQAGVTRMSAKELSEGLAKIHDCLKRLKDQEEGVAAVCFASLFGRSQP